MIYCQRSESNIKCFHLEITPLVILIKTWITETAKKTVKHLSVMAFTEISVLTLLSVMIERQATLQLLMCKIL